MPKLTTDVCIKAQCITTCLCHFCLWIIDLSDDSAQSQVGVRDSTLWRADLVLQGGGGGGGGEGVAPLTAAMLGTHVMQGRDLTWRGQRPARTRKRLDLPLPLGPMIMMEVPGGTSKVRSRTRGVPSGLFSATLQGQTILCPASPE